MIATENKEVADLAGEAAVIGSMMLQDKAITKANMLLDPDDFYYPQHKVLFSTITEMFLEKGRYDVVVFRNRLKSAGLIDVIGGVEYIAKLLQAVPSAANIKHYCEIVKKHSDIRRLIIASDKITKIADRADIEVKEKLSKIETLIEEAKKGKEIERVYKTSGQDLVNAVDALAINSEGIKTGFHDIDYKLHGLAKGSFNIIAARPSMGKTSLACNIAYNMAKGGYKPVIYSLEMTWQQITQRMICSVGGIDLHDIRTLGREDNSELWLKVDKSATEINNHPMYIIDKGITSISDITMSIKSMVRNYGVDIVFIDFVQLLEVGDKKENRQQEITTICRRLKAIAKNEDIPLVVLSQLNRGVESRTDKKPLMSDLRESGSLEETADVIMFIYREDYYNRNQSTYTPTNTADILIAKNRNGATGNERLFFHPQFVRFTNYVPNWEKL